MATSSAAVGIFFDFIRDHDFPCVGAKSTLARGGLRIIVASDLACDGADQEILSILQGIPREQDARNGLVAVVALFPATPVLSETSFERRLWGRLQALHDADRADFAWNSRISSDPTAADFALSIGGAGFYIVGLHPGASRIARRAPMAIIAFNPHAQFRALKSAGTYARLRQAVRHRDVAIQGDINPMLTDHGTASEAPQYSGRAVTADWECPFQAGERDHNV